MLQGRDQDRKLRINLLYSTMGGVGGVKRDLRCFKKVLGMVLGMFFVDVLFHAQLQRGRARRPGTSQKPQ